MPQDRRIELDETHHVIIDAISSDPAKSLLRIEFTLEEVEVKRIVKIYFLEWKRWKEDNPTGTAAQYIKGRLSEVFASVEAFIAFEENVGDIS